MGRVMEMLREKRGFFVFEGAWDRVRIGLKILFSPLVCTLLGHDEAHFMQECEGREAELAVCKRCGKVAYGLIQITPEDLKEEPLIH